MAIKVGIIGWGNVGRGVYEAIKRNPDTELAGIISRNPQRVLGEFTGQMPPRVFDAINPPSRDLIDSVDVAVLCGGSAKDLPEQGPFYASFFNTVDSFDTHDDIPAYFEKMNSIALANERVAIISAGWDPGTFSLERVLGDAFLPGSKKETFWGPGVSQGHSDAIRRKVGGVADAIQYTMPYEAVLDAVRKGKKPELTTAFRHWRDCYVALKEGVNPEKVKEAIVTMPKYFAGYNTRVTFETAAQIAERKKQMPHGGFVLTSGETGKGNKALVEYKNDWGSNPEATGSILVACARANYRLQHRCQAGAFTMLDIPPAYFSPHSRETLLKSWM